MTGTHHVAEPILSAFEEALRRIVREEVEAALAARDERIRTVTHRAASTPVQTAATVSTHAGEIKVWHDVNAFPLKSGSKTYTIAVGNPVKVKGLGRGGAVGDGYRVTRIQQRGGDINVDVKKGVEHTRTVKADKIVYKRPKKGS